MDEFVEMTGAELQIVRLGLGLTLEQLGDYLGVESRSVRRWEAGTHPVPRGVQQEVYGLIEDANQAVDRLIDDVISMADEPVIPVYRYAEDFIVAGPPGTIRSVGWHRQIVFRALCELPVYPRIVYATRDA